MKTQQLVTPIIFFLISQFDISNGDQGTACQKYKDDPCSDIICANENWISTSFDVHDKLNITSNARADGCVLPWVRECEAITDKQSCKNADCTWESSRRGGGHCTKEFCWEFWHPELCGYFWPRCDWEPNTEQCKER